MPSAYGDEAAIVRLGGFLGCVRAFRRLVPRQRRARNEAPAAQLWPLEAGSRLFYALLVAWRRVCSE